MMQIFIKTLMTGVAWEFGGKAVTTVGSALFGSKGSTVAGLATNLAKPVSEALLGESNSMASKRIEASSKATATANLFNPYGVQQTSSFNTQNIWSGVKAAITPAKKTNPFDFQTMMDENKALQQKVKDQDKKTKALNEHMSQIYTDFYGFQMPQPAA